MFTWEDDIICTGEKYVDENEFTSELIDFFTNENTNDKKSNKGKIFFECTDEELEDLPF